MHTGMYLSRKSYSEVFSKKKGRFCEKAICHLVEKIKIIKTTFKQPDPNCRTSKTDLSNKVTAFITEQVTQGWSNLHQAG